MSAITDSSHLYKKIITIDNNNNDLLILKTNKVNISVKNKINKLKMPLAICLSLIMKTKITEVIRKFTLNQAKHL